MITLSDMIFISVRGKTFICERTKWPEQTRIANEFATMASYPPGSNLWGIEQDMFKNQ